MASKNKAKSKAPVKSAPAPEADEDEGTQTTPSGKTILKFTGLEDLETVPKMSKKSYGRTLEIVNALKAKVEEGDDFTCKVLQYPPERLRSAHAAARQLRLSAEANGLEGVYFPVRSGAIIATTDKRYTPKSQRAEE